MGFCPSLIRLTKDFLQARSTTFQLGDFQSEPKSLTIGLPQGSPLSVILYILYNTPLLRQADDEPNTISLGFIDDVAFVTAQSTTQEVTTQLQKLADKELEWGSRYGAAFDRAKSQWMVLSHKPIPNPLPSLTLGDVVLEPQPQIKWLGVLIDPKLQFTYHINAQIGKGTAIANRLACLARTGWGIPLRQCKLLASALVHSRVDYACVAWHRYGKTSGYPAKLQQLDNITHRFSLGVFRTHPTPFLLHDTCSAPPSARLDAKVDAAILRLLTLPNTNPAARLAKAVFTRNRQAHRSTVHHALGHADNICRSLPSLPEVLEASKAGKPPPAHVQGVIKASSEEASTFVSANIDQPPPQTFISFCDGSHQPEKGAGAAVVVRNTANPDAWPTLSVRVGDADTTTPYQAELVGLELAIANARSTAQPGTLFFWFLTDNQTMIQGMTEPLRLKPGMLTCLRLRQNLSRLISRYPNSTAALIWCPSKSAIEGMVKADAAAKTATTLRQTIDQPPNPSAILKRIKEQVLGAARLPPTSAALTRLLGNFDPTSTFKALSKLSRPDATLVAQLRSGHCPLNSYLKRFQAVESPLCDLCKQVEDVDHFLLQCRKFAGLRRDLFKAAGQSSTATNRVQLLTNPNIFDALATFGRRSYRFYKARHRRFIPNQHRQTTMTGPANQRPPQTTLQPIPP